MSTAFLTSEVCVASTVHAAHILGSPSAACSGAALTIDSCHPAAAATQPARPHPMPQCFPGNPTPRGAQSKRCCGSCCFCSVTSGLPHLSHSLPTPHSHNTLAATAAVSSPHRGPQGGTTGGKLAVADYTFFVVPHHLIQCLLTVPDQNVLLH